MKIRENHVGLLCTSGVALHQEASGWEEAKAISVSWSTALAVLSRGSQLHH